MKHDAVGLVQRLNEAPDLFAHDTLERRLFGGDDVDANAPRAERSRHFETDKARPYHHGMPGVLGHLHDGAAVGV